MRTFLLLLLGFVFQNAFSQSTFNRRLVIPNYSSDGMLVEEAPGGGYFVHLSVVDTAHPFQSNTFIGNNALMKTDTSGNPVWITAFKDPQAPVNSNFFPAFGFTKMVVAQDSGITLLGYDWMGRKLLTHFDKNGVQQWFRRISYTGPGGMLDGDFIQTAAGNYIISMSVNHTVSIFCFDANGQRLWSRYQNPLPNSNQILNAVHPLELPSGDLLFSWTGTNGQNTLMRTDATGTVTWINMYGAVNNTYNASESQPCDILPDPANNQFLLLEHFASGLLLRKLDYNGNEVWSKAYRDGSQYFLTVTADHLALAPDKGFLISGIANYHPSFSNIPDRVFLMKTDSTGNFEWFHFLNMFTMSCIPTIPDASYDSNGQIMICGLDTICSATSSTGPLIAGCSLARLNPQGFYDCNLADYPLPQIPVTTSVFNWWTSYEDTLPVVDSAAVIVQAFFPSFSASEACPNQQPSSVVSLMEDNSFSIAPNPADNLLTLYMPDAFRSGTVCFFDDSGRLLKQAALTGTTATFEVGDFPPGLYLVRVTEGGRQYRQKFIKR